MEVILLERVAKLGQIGDVVRVKDGFARNFLLPRKKALRATEANRKRFEGQRVEIEARNLELKHEAKAIAEKLDGHSIVLIRQAGESGQLYGSVSPRDIAEALGQSRFKVSREQVVLNTPIKALGLHTVPVHLHPEVDVKITVNVARSAEEAERQARGEVIATREETSLEDLGLEVGAALAEAGPRAEISTRACAAAPSFADGAGLASTPGVSCSRSFRVSRSNSGAPAFARRLCRRADL